MKLTPIQDTTEIEVATGLPAVGSIKLWVPEAISTNTGQSAVYPAGTWEETNGEWRQRIALTEVLGTGNCPKIDPHTFECCGIRIPADNPVEWETRVRATTDTVTFTIRLTNLGKTPMRKAGAPICCKFLHAPWWSDPTTFGVAGGKAVSLAELGRDAGQPNGYQAYLLKDQTYNHPFFQEFWGFNRHRLDRALLISENTTAGICAGIESDAAYLVHSNLENPCTDLLLAFGDLGPGESATATGRLWVRRGTARELIKA